VRRNALDHKVRKHEGIETKRFCLGRRNPRLQSLGRKMEEQGEASLTGSFARCVGQELIAD
jgi:hypothetical protein